MNRNDSAENEECDHAAQPPSHSSRRLTGGLAGVGVSFHLINASLAAAILLCLALLAGCGKGGAPVVVIYTSQDEVYAEPILKDFEKQTGIEAQAVYDSEAVKTVGLVNRLLTERPN